MDQNTQTSSPSYLGDSIQKTLKHFPKLIIYSLLISVVYAALSLTHHLMDFNKMPRGLTLFMIAWLLWIPLIAGYLHFHMRLINDEPANFKQSFINGFSKILGIVSTLVGVLLIPSLIVGISAIAGFVCVQRGFEQALWPIIVVASVIILLLLNNTLLSLIIVSTEEHESGNALSKSKQLNKGKYIQTFFSSTLAFFLLVLLFTSPIWIGLLVELSSTMQLIVIVCACLDVFLIAPFLWSMMIADLKAKEHHQQTSEPVQETLVQRKMEVKETPKGKMKDQDWF